MAGMMTKVRPPRFAPSRRLWGTEVCVCVCGLLQQRLHAEVWVIKEEEAQVSGSGNFNWAPPRQPILVGPLRLRSNASPSLP